MRKWIATVAVLAALAASAVAGAAGTSYWTEQGIDVQVRGHPRRHGVLGDERRRSPLRRDLHVQVRVDRLARVVQDRVRLSSATARCTDASRATRNSANSEEAPERRVPLLLPKRANRLEKSAPEA